MKSTDEQYKLDLLHYDYQEYYEWGRWSREIPNINFPKEWNVKIIPPSNGAIVRFIINDFISVYLDCYNKLGYYKHPNNPYWEVYPYKDDIFRCGISEIDELLHTIQTSIDDMELG